MNIKLFLNYINKINNNEIAGNYSHSNNLTCNGFLKMIKTAFSL